MGSRICDYCRKKLAKLPDLDTIIDSPAAKCTSPTDEQYFDTPEAIASVNKCLFERGETPLPAAATKSKQMEDKIGRITEAMKGLLLEEAPKISPQCSDESEMILQLKEKFQTTTKRSEQLQILTILPQSWTKRQIQAEFGVTDYMARKSKQLVREKGVLSSLDPKPGHSLPSETVELVTDFYQSDEISRMMPGRKDFVSVRQEGRRVHVQKRLVLSNLKKCIVLSKMPFQTKTLASQNSQN